MSQLGLEMREERDERRRGRRATLLALVMVLAVVLGMVGGGAYVLNRLRGGGGGGEDYAGPGSGNAVVEVHAGDSAVVIGRTLAKADVVASSTAFAHAALANPDYKKIQPGTYAMRTKMKASDAVLLLLDPTARVEAKVTLREGLRLTASIAALAQGTSVPAADYRKAAKDAKAIGLPGYAKGNAEGFVFPATYTFAPGTSATEQLAATVKRYGQAAQDSGLADGATIDGKHYSPEQLLVVASILEKEAPPTAMAEVARVLYNRLNIGMRLQLDSTVSYVTGKPGVTTTAADRAIDSPYNTYRNAGLPPAPIDSPGEAAMKAAGNPAQSDNLYFVTVNLDTGETKFAKTLAEHNRNVEEFRSWLRAHPQ